MSHISVTIPSFNHARFLGRTIESALNQRFGDLDVVVVDDASTDNSFEVANRYCTDSRVRCLKNKQNLGLAKNWNRCLDIARGPLVIVLGSDDLLDPGYLELVSQIFDEYPDLGLVYASVHIIGAHDEIIYKGIEHPPRLYRRGDDAITHMLTVGINTVTTVIRRECYEKLGGYNEAIWNGPDIEFCARIASHYDIYDLGKVLGYFRLHEAKTGHLGYLRKEILDSYMLGVRLTWGYLSHEGQRHLGISNLERFVAEDGAGFAINGAMVTIGYGRPDLARYYLRRASRLDRCWWRRLQYWKSVGLLLAPTIGKRVVRYHMKI